MRLFALATALVLPSLAFAAGAQTDANSTSPSIAAPVERPGTDEAVELAGDLRPAQAAELSFKAGGTLVSFKVGRGEKVKKGQTLGQLSDAEARAQYAQAEAGVKAAAAQVAIAEDAERRVGDLVQNNAAPEMQKISSGLQAEAARAGLAGARALLALAQANLDNHTLRAPFDGTLARVPDGIGSNIAPGAAVARIEKLDLLVLQAALGERELDRIKVGSEVLVKAPSGREVVGRVRAVVRSLDAVSRRAPVEVEVPNADGSLVAGSYVRARLRTPVAAR